MSYKNSLIHNHQVRAEERIDNRGSVIGRNVIVWIFVAWILYPIGASLSAFTEGFYIYYIMGENTLPFLRWAATILLCVMIEGSVLFLGQGAIDDLQAGALAGTGGEKFLFAIKTIGFIAFFSLSIYLSLQGGPKFQEWREKTQNPIELQLTPESDAEETYAMDLATQNTVISDARNTKWRGTITGSAMKAMRSAQAEVTRINGLVEAEKARIRESNQELKDKYYAELAITTGHAFTLTGVGQIVVLFCIAFIGVFNQEVERGLGGTKEEGAAAGARNGQESNARQIGFGNNTAAAAHHPNNQGNPYGPTSDTTPDDRRAIGFKHYEHAPKSPGTGGPSSSPSSYDGDVALGTVTTGAPEDGDGHNVETRLDNATTADKDSLEAQSRLASWRSHHANLCSYTNRNPTKSNIASIARLEELKGHEEKQLALMGWRIELQESPRKAYILVPV
jgi:hypothetical protein